MAKLLGTAALSFCFFLGLEELLSLLEDMLQEGLAPRFPLLPARGLKLCKRLLKPQTNCLR